MQVLLLTLHPVEVAAGQAVALTQVSTCLVAVEVVHAGRKVYGPFVVVSATTTAG